jgi:hypothetical protein
MSNNKEYLKIYEDRLWIQKYYKYYRDYLSYIGCNREQFRITNSNLDIVKLNRVDKNNDFGLILDLSCRKDKRFITYDEKMVILNSVKLKMYDDEKIEINDDTILWFENVIISDEWPTIARCHYKDVKTENGYQMVKPSRFNQRKNLMIWTSVFENSSIPNVISSALGKPKIDLCINPEYTKFEIVFDSWIFDKIKLDEYKDKSIEYLNREELKPIKEKIVNDYIKKMKVDSPVLSAYKINWETKEVTKE